MSLSPHLTAFCLRCEEDVPVEKFARDGSKASGRKSLCKACDRAKARAYYERNRLARIAKATADHRKRNKLFPGWQQKYDEWRYAESHPEQYKRRLTRDYVKAVRRDPCSYCGDVTTALDHVVPKSRGGSDDWANLAASCESCNRRKGARSLLTFLLSPPSTPKPITDLGRDYFLTDFELCRLP